MANEMPKPESYRGLSRKVLQYAENFSQIVEKLKQGDSPDWASMEELVDVKEFRREGVFLGDYAEVSTWQQYRELVTGYGGMTLWEGTLRRITEVPSLVYLELEERNTRDGVVDVSNTVSIYEFNQAGKVRKLDIYVSHKEKR